MKKQSKRKFPERTSKRRTQNIFKREPSNSEGSRSDSNGGNQSSSPESNSSTDTKCRKQNKRLRRDPTNFKFQNRLRPRNHLKHKRHSSSPLLTRHTRRFGLRSRSSSPENREVNMKKSPEKVSLSPLHTRSQRPKGPIIHHVLRSSTQKPQKFISGDSSESDELVVNNQSARISSSSNSQNTSNKKVFPKNRSSVKRHDTAYNESEESSDVEEKPRKLTRATAKLKSEPTRALTASPRRKESPRKNNFKERIQTRNRGQRTVRYGEDSNDEEVGDGEVDDADDGEDSFKNSDSENTEPVFSFSSRGRLRKLTNHVRAFFRE